eukprot:UN09724
MRRHDPHTPTTSPTQIFNEISGCTQPQQDIYIFNDIFIAELYGDNNCTSPTPVITDTNDASKSKAYKLYAVSQYAFAHNEILQKNITFTKLLQQQSNDVNKLRDGILIAAAPEQLNTGIAVDYTQSTQISSKQDFYVNNFKWLSLS